MVAVRVSELEQSRVPNPRQGLQVLEGGSRRVAPRTDVAMRAWLMDGAGTQRGYIVDVSETGARISGVGMRVPVGERLVLKFQLRPGEPPRTCRVHAIRYHLDKTVPELAVQFLDLNFDDWFELARVLDGKLSPSRAGRPLKRA